METRKLYRSNTNKMLAGVCGGLGEFLWLLLRLSWLCWFRCLV